MYASSRREKAGSTAGSMSRREAGAALTTSNYIVCVCVQLAGCWLGHLSRQLNGENGEEERI